MSVLSASSAHLVQCKDLLHNHIKGENMFALERLTYEPHTELRLVNDVTNFTASFVPYVIMCHNERGIVRSERYSMVL